MLSNVGQNNVFGVVAISKKHGALPLEISWASHSDTALDHASGGVAWQLNCLRPIRALEAVQRVVQKPVAFRLGKANPRMGIPTADGLPSSICIRGDFWSDKEVLASERRIGRRGSPLSITPREELFARQLAGGKEREKLPTLHFAEDCRP